MNDPSIIETQEILARPYISFKSPQMQHVSPCSLDLTPQQVIGGLVSNSEARTESCAGITLASVTRQLVPQTPTLIQLIMTLRAAWELLRPTQD